MLIKNVYLNISKGQNQIEIICFKRSISKSKETEQNFTGICEVILESEAIYIDKK